MIGRTHKRIGTRTLRCLLAFSVAAFVASSVSYAKPKPPAVAALNEAICTELGGVWTAVLCTIPEGTAGVASASFKIGDDATLDIKGSVTINGGITVTNLGTIIVENAGGVLPGDPEIEGTWPTGVLVYGTLDNSGTISVKNHYEYTDTSSTCDTEPCTEGITVSLLVTKDDPNDPKTWRFFPGTLANSGTMVVQNSGRTRGIKNIGNLANSANGTITVQNNGSTSVGVYNRRILLADSPVNIYTNATLTNAGSITVSNTGDYVGFPSGDGVPDPNGYGVYNVGLFTNSASGTFTINPGSDAAVGLYNNGSITSYGTFTNNRGAYNQASVLESTLGTVNFINGTMINYGTTLAGDSQAVGTGTFLNLNVMINLGTITSYGLMYDATSGTTMVNYGAIYNHGRIEAGVNKGFCIDELDGYGGC